MEKDSLLEIEDDEAEHVAQLSDEITKFLDLATSGARIATRGIQELDYQPRVYEASGLATLLLVKAARSIQYGAVGLRLGYYAGAGSSLRSAYEALAHAALFRSDEKEMPRWLRNELRQSDTDERIKDQSKQRALARRALLSWADEPSTIRNALRGFKKWADKTTHATLIGLVKEFGLDPETVLPPGVAYSESPDLDTALDRYLLLATIGQEPSTSVEEVEDQIVEVSLRVKYEEETAWELSMVAFYLAHRLLDMVGQMGHGKEFDRLSAEWHSRL